MFLCFKKVSTGPSKEKLKFFFFNEIMKNQVVNDLETPRSTLAPKGLAEGGIMGVCPLEPPLSPALSYSKLFVMHSIFSFIYPHEKKSQFLPTKTCIFTNFSCLMGIYTSNFKF